MTLPIERARSRRPITWLTLLGVLLLPALIGGILVIALQNPTERLESMTAAVVNLDEPVTIDDQYTPLGRQLAAGLVDGSDEADSNLTWVISNEEDAAEGLAGGTYQAVVTIPKSFSADATSAGTALKGGEGAAERARITVTTPPDGRVADGLITEQLAATAARTMGTMLSEATIDNVLVSFRTLGDQIGDAADGASQLASGTQDAAAGAAELPDGAAQLADGAGSLASGASQLADGTGALAGGASQLADGADQARRGTDSLTGGATELSNGAGALSSGLNTIAGKTREAADGAAQLGQGLTDGAAQLKKNGLVPSELQQAAGGAKQAAEGIAGAAEQATAATAGVQQGVDSLAAGLSGLSAACDGSAEFCAQLAGLADAAQQLKQPAAGAAQAAAGIAEYAGAAVQATAGTATGLAALNEQGTAEISGQLQQAGSAATALGAGLDQLAGGVDQSASGAQDLSDGATQLSAGARELSDGVGRLGDGARELAGGVGSLGDGARGLAGGATQLSDGATALGDGAGALADGLGDLAEGTGDLADGLSTAADALPSFSDEQSKSLASVIADPVASDSESGGMFGPTAIPLLAAVVLWFGALASFIALRAVPGNPLTSRRSSIGMVLRGFWPAALIGAAQGVLVALIVQIVASYDAATWWSFAGFAVLAGVSFAAINQALVAVLGGIGRWISALVGVVAVATGLISTIPAWLAGLGAAMPTSPALNGMIAGSGSAFAGLAVWAVLALGAATLAVATRRTASAKTALATA